MIRQAILLINMEENVNDAMRLGVLPQENFVYLRTFLVNTDLEYDVMVIRQ